MAGGESSSAVISPRRIVHAAGADAVARACKVNSPVAHPAVNAPAGAGAASHCAAGCRACGQSQASRRRPDFVRATVLRPDSGAAGLARRARCPVEIARRIKHLARMTSASASWHRSCDVGPVAPSGRPAQRLCGTREAHMETSMQVAAFRLNALPRSGPRGQPRVHLDEFGASPSRAD